MRRDIKKMFEMYSVISTSAGYIKGARMCIEFFEIEAFTEEDGMDVTVVYTKSGGRYTIFIPYEKFKPIWEEYRGKKLIHIPNTVKGKRHES